LPAANLPGQGAPKDARRKVDLLLFHLPTLIEDILSEEIRMAHETIIVETKGRVGVVRLNRPNALNALNAQLIKELSSALEGFESDDGIGCIVITGNEKAFAAGADIKEMQSKTYMQAFKEDFISKWYAVSNARKPVIAAVAGFALGGGCELAMMCDIIIAADTARFGQPEIKLGVMPGSGGTQRLIRQIGKAKAMEMCLTGRMMEATEAERANLVARVVPAASLMEEAMKTAEAIASMSLPITMMTKESINRAYETTLAEGVRFERRVFHSQFAVADQKEGMAAFVEKRKANFQHK
jgi:enoyl-CoA hydratase